jgi:putative addiction module killer protein
MPNEQEVGVYARSDGREPFTQWLRGLRDGQTRNRIRQRIARVRLGNFGDARSVGAGVHELRVQFGPGFRVYFGREDNAVVILLCGGDKSTQAQDIERAHDYWRDYRSRSDE